MRSTDEYGGIPWWDLQMSMVESLDEIYRWVWWNTLMRSTDEYGGVPWWDLQMSMVESLDEIYSWVWWTLVMRSTDEYDDISWSLNHVRRTIDPVLVDHHDLFFTWSHWSILHGILAAPYLGVSPLREDGASICPIDPVCSVSRVFLLNNDAKAKAIF